jgi:hypothetical protein
MIVYHPISPPMTIIKIFFASTIFTCTIAYEITCIIWYAFKLTINSSSVQTGYGWDSYEH